MRPTYAAQFVVCTLFATGAGAASPPSTSPDNTFGVGSLTLDSNTSLVWLDTTLTKGQSVDGVVAGFGGYLAQGLEIASTAEVQEFFANAGITTVGIATDAAPQIAAAESVIALLGVTASSPDFSMTSGFAERHDLPGQYSQVSVEVIHSASICSDLSVTAPCARTFVVNGAFSSAQTTSFTGVLLRKAVVQDVAYSFDFEITQSRYFGADAAIAAQLPPLGMASGELFYNAAALGSVGSPGTDYVHSPAGSYGLRIRFGNGVTWSTDPAGSFVAKVINRSVGAGADVLRFSSGSDAVISVASLTTDFVFAQFVDPSSSILSDERLPSEIDVADWPNPNNIDLRALDSSNSEFRVFGTIIDLRPGTANQAPTADAGADQSIRAGETVSLDGTSSFDDNTATANLLFSWSFVSLPAGSNAELDGADTATPSFVADLSDTYVVQLTVTDESGLAGIADEIIVSADNLAPTAVAGNGQFVLVGSTVTLDGTASFDPENDPLGYQWLILSAPDGSSAVLSSTTAVATSLVTDVAGLYEVQLRVSDSIGPGAPDVVRLTAATPQDYSQALLLSADALVRGLASQQVTTAGNQTALLNFLAQAAIGLQAGDLGAAIDKVEKSLMRTDGCVERGSPDGNGPGRDWIVDCAPQATLYSLLSAVLDALGE